MKYSGFWNAFYTLEDVLYRYNWQMDRYEFEDNENLITEALTEFNAIVTDLLTGGQPVVSASAIPCKYLQQETRALTTEEVQQLITQFVAGAVRVQKAGCDGVELHAAHGYLLQQFLSPYTNKREDQYGGSFENRCRFLWNVSGLFVRIFRKGCLFS